VTAAPGIGTVAVDDAWRLHADPRLTAAWTASQFGSVLLHHVCHLLRSHGERAVAAGVAEDDSQAWIRAADAEINDDLTPAGLELPGRPVLPQHLGAEPGRLAEEYFGRQARGDCGPSARAAAATDLADSAPATTGSASSGLADAGPADTGSAGGSGLAEAGSAGWDDTGSARAGCLGGGRSVRDAGSRGAAGADRDTPRPAGHGGWDLDCGSGADGRARPWDRPADGHALSSQQARLLRRQVAQDILRHGREAGDVPGGLLRWARETIEPAVDWRRVLGAELRRAVADTVGAVDYSYRRPSRRATVVGAVVLPALRRPVPEVAVVCDTSGSMTDELLATCLAEVEGLLRSLGLARSVRVLACDAAAGTARRVSSARRVELTGGGGTDMGAGIAAAAALRPRPAIAVVLTDGFTPWPARPPAGIKIIAGLLGGGAPDGPPWAQAVRIPGEARR
jgi:predicted metal-dependent peptidase